MPSFSRGRRVFFTWNNWQDRFPTKQDVYDHFSALPHISGFSIGFEVGESGTPHLQGLLRFSQPKNFNTVKGYFESKAHFESVIDFNKSREYTQKDGDFIEYGMMIDSGGRTDILEFVEEVTEGASDYELVKHHPEQFIRYGSMVERVRQSVLERDYATTNRDNIKVFYLGGLTGSGKTSTVVDIHGHKDIYRVNDYRHPFDGYRGQKVLVLDEFKSNMDVSLMLNVLDRYPLRLPARYADRWAAFEVVYVLSNDPIGHFYEDLKNNKDNETRKALLRRFTEKFWMDYENQSDIKTKIESILAGTPQNENQEEKI